MMIEVNKNILKKIYTKRNEHAKKFDYGHLLVIGGSRLYSGSPAFNALAAYRAGTDLVTIAAPERAANIIATFAPDLITFPLRGDKLDRSHLDELLKLSLRKTACVIGGGLGRDPETMEAIRYFVKEVNLPCVIDADAIHALAFNPKIVHEKNFILTPNTKEFYVFSGLNPTNHLNERIRYTEEISRKYKTTIILKGHVDVISNGNETALCKAGSPALTKGGLGDTLAGVCGALLARDVEPFIAGCAAAFINGKAGEMAAHKYSESLMASDLIKEIPTIIKQTIRY